jgi:hypothetical protein
MRIPLDRVNSHQRFLPFSCPNYSPTLEQRIDLEQAVMEAKEVLENISKYAPLVGQLTQKVRTLCLSAIDSLSFNSLAGL